jgi:steroid 5-alpha reductase family enzyme
LIVALSSTFTAILAAVPVQALGVVLAVMVVLWLASLKLRDASIVDPYWGSGFALLAWFYLFLEDGVSPRGWLIVILVSIWGLRLSSHLLVRSRGKGEDYRYRQMRETHGARFWWVSLFTVFLLQGIIQWTVALPVWQVIRSHEPLAVTWLDALGVSVFIVGFLFEALGDWQLARFKADPANRGKLLDRGLWRYTRHPNYFGDALVWWGLTLIALATPVSLWTLLSPILMTTLLIKVSGVALLEADLRRSKPGYREYVESTNAFLPWFPRAAGRS